MNDLTKIHEFLTTLRERFTNENITCLDLHYYKINPKNDFITTWLNVNPEFELVGTFIYKNTRKEKIEQQKKYIYSLQNKFIEKGKQLKQLERDINNDEMQLTKQNEILIDLMTK